MPRPRPEHGDFPERPEKPELTILGEIDPARAEFKLLDSGFLSLRVGDVFYPKVTLTRLFPYFHENRYISVLVDKEEVGILDDIEALPEQQQETVQSYLRYKYYIPTITAIREAHDTLGYLYLTAVTPGGEVELCISDTASNIRVMHGKTVNIRDVEGNLYHIPDYNTLDAASRQRIELFL